MSRLPDTYDIYTRLSKRPFGPQVFSLLFAFKAPYSWTVRPQVRSMGPHYAEVVVPLRETWVADAESGIVGVMVLHDGELSQLYLAPDWRGRGLGDRFVALAKERNPGRLGLWAFQVNGPAQRFYERHGFVAVTYTDGSGNEEREPDVRYEWRP